MSQFGIGQGGKSSTGLDENVAGLLAYVLGFISGIVFLVIEKDSKFVKFHAIQSIAISAVLFVINLVLGWIPIIGLIVGLLLVPVSFVLWIFLMYQAYKGKWFKLPLLGEFSYEQAHK
ncbi:DUF4870 domain-containing protein [Paenibacillus chartarius]|uniref:DUF4870 domain-containing protein n=1 Tax=Paenibacillus chartarius TaxID=747481 RepID=A0ABV6DMW9_9BACL